MGRTRVSNRWPDPELPGLTDHCLSCLHFQAVLQHLQGKLEQEARVLVSSGQTEVLEQLKGEALTWDFL